MDQQVAVILIVLCHLMKFGMRTITYMMGVAMLDLEILLDS